MESTKRRPPLTDDHEAKKAKFTGPESSAPPKLDQPVVLNPADCDLDFNVEENGLQGSALYEQGFAYCWSGARANVGIKGGKYCFGCKIVSAQPVEMVDTPLDQQHVCRVGLSRGDDAVSNLGETEHSFGFGGTGKFSHAGKFPDYGEKYGVGDVVVCAVDLENKPMASIGFSKNGKWLGTAKYFNAGQSGLGVVDSQVSKREWESALFPHFLLKNVVVHLQFSVEDGLVPEEGYEPWASACKEGNAVMGPTFSELKDCEVMMMVGLPASGKSTWAEKWVKEHPEKQYVLLGTNQALDQMKVPGLLRKHNYGERFDRLMDRATGIFNTLLSRASKTPRNFIIDQTNVYESARKRKLKPFAYYRKIAVVVFPRPEELKVRAEKRFKEMGKEVPVEAVNEMLANYVLPSSKDMPRADEFFDEVIFAELGRAEAQRCLDKMKADLISKRTPSPYSCEPSISSYNSPPTQYSRESSLRSYYTPPSHNQGSLPAVDRHWQSSYPPQPSPPTAFSTGHLHRADFEHHGYGGHNEYRRNDGITPVGGISDPYRTYGVSDSYNRPNFMGGGSSALGGAADPYRSGGVEPYERRASFDYNSPGGYRGSPVGYRGSPVGYGGSPGGYGGVPVGFRADVSSNRESMNLPHPQYDSPYGYRAPIQRPPYGNFPTGMQHPGAHIPRRDFY